MTNMHKSLHLTETKNPLYLFINRQSFGDIYALSKPHIPFLDLLAADPADGSDYLVDLFEALEQVRQAILEQKSFAKVIAAELVKIAKTGDLERLKSEAFEKIDRQFSNIWMITKSNLEDRFNIVLG